MVTNDGVLASRPTVKPPLLLKQRFQLSGGILFAVVIPALVGPNILLWFPGTISSQNNSTIVTAFAVIIGYYFFRKLVNFPGVRASSYIIPTFTAAYVGALLILLFARLDYSRFQVGVSYVMCTSWFFLVYSWSRRLKPHQLAVVPFGEVDDLKSMKSIEWHFLSSPKNNRKITGLVVDLRANLTDEWERYITDCAVNGIPVFHVKNFRESMSGKVEIKRLSENVLGSLLPNVAYMKIKQVADFLVSLAILPFFLPIFLLVAIAIKLDDGGNVFYVQKRMGYQANSFRVIKFRTMRQGSSRADDLEDAKTKLNDERITRTGSFLRRTRLDELPQIFNVIMGHMSLIGPRPEVNVLSKQYEEGLPYYRYRHVVRPGITGWAQVNQGHVAELEDVNQKLHYDFYYIKNFSPWLDALIVFRTVKIILTGKGAV